MNCLGYVLMCSLVLLNRPACRDMLTSPLAARSVSLESDHSLTQGLRRCIMANSGPLGRPYVPSPTFGVLNTRPCARAYTPTTARPTVRSAGDLVALPTHR